MIVIDQQGNKHEILELTIDGKKVIGQGESLKEPKIVLGTYNDFKRTCDVFAEVWVAGVNRPKDEYVMPVK